MDFNPKVSPITGKFVQINGVTEIVGYLTFNCIYFITVENKFHKVFAVRDMFGILGWITERNEKDVLLFILDKVPSINVYLKAVSSPFIAKKRRNN